MTNIVFIPDKPIDCQKLWYLNDTVYKAYSIDELLELIAISEVSPDYICMIYPHNKQDCVTGFTYYNKDKYNTINGCVKSVRKSFVNEIQIQAFGYGSEAIKGQPYCEKHEGQAIKDMKFGKRYTGQTRQNYFFQVDMQDRPGEWREYRIYCFSRKCNDICCDKVIQKWKLTESVQSLSQVFTDKEVQMLNNYVQAFKLDFGELDVMHDKHGRLHVLDVNLTPGNRACFTLKKDEVDTLFDMYRKEFTKLLDEFASR
jgi:hypothetical protein